jgi:hypothetical protein
MKTGQARLGIALIIIAISAGTGCFQREPVRGSGSKRNGPVEISHNVPVIQRENWTISRYEVADHGGGVSSSARGSQGHVIRRSTIGGSYARRQDVQSTNYKFAAGIHGNPSGR